MSSFPNSCYRAFDGLVAERGIRQIALDEQTPLLVRFDITLVPLMIGYRFAALRSPVLIRA